MKSNFYEDAWIEFDKCIKLDDKAYIAYAKQSEICQLLHDKKGAEKYHRLAVEANKKSEYVKIEAELKGTRY